MDVERIFRLLGNPGRFQVLVYVLLCCNYFPVAVNHLVMAIYGAKTPHHCRQTLTSESNNVSAEFELNHFDSSADSCYEKEGSGNTTESCHNGWQYLNQYREYNIIMQWDLVCDKAYMVSMATSVYFGGVMLGGIVFGTLADRFGRKPLMLTALYGHIFVGTALAFANSYPMFVALRFLLGVLLQGLQTCTFVLLMELFSVKHRTVVGTAFELFWAVGVIWLAVVAMLVREWRFIQLALTLPSVLTIVYIWAIPESFRWLIAHGRLAEAEQVIKKAAKFNQVHIPEDALKPLKKQESNPLVTSGEENGMVIDCERTNVKDRKYTICDMFRTTQLCKRSLIMFYIWFVVAVSYYGLTLNITSLSGDKYINLLLGGLLELPAYAIAMFIINRFGRRLPLFVYLSVGGILCILAGCLPSSSPVVSSRTLQLMSTGFAVFGRCSIASCWSVILLYTSELYPTVIRNIGMGTCAFWNRIGGMIAPQILLLGNYTTEWLPVLIFGCLALVAAGLTFLLPETHGLPLPDTLHDTEATETFAQPKSAMISEEAGGMDELGSLHTDKV